MQLIFRYNRVIGGKTYQAGPKPQEVPDKFKSNKFVQFYLKAGDISLVAQGSDESKPAEKSAPQSQKSAK